jgi:quercetin dioxygenase-like cupin family protein
MEFTADNDEPGEFYQHDGDEFLSVLEGTVQVDFEGRESSVLTVGDSIYFEGGIRHRWHAARPGGYRLFVVKQKPEARLLDSRFVGGLDADALDADLTDDALDGDLTGDA